jgi:hypothetical protein
MTTSWIFGRGPQIVRPGFASVPVLSPADVAMRLTLSDCSDRARRVFGDHLVGGVELAGWRCTSAGRRVRSGGRFPWEMTAVSDA